MRLTICVGALLAAIAASAGPPLAADQGKSGDGTDWGCGGHVDVLMPDRADSRQFKRTGIPMMAERYSWHWWWYLSRACLLSELSYRVAGPAEVPPVAQKWRDDVRAALRKALESPTVPLAAEAALALGRAGDPRDAELLVKTATDEHRETKVRALASLGLGLMPVEADAKAALRTRDALLSVAHEAVANNDDHLELWADAVYALGLRSDEAALPRLVEFIRKHRDHLDTDHERGVHREILGAAIGTLGLFGDSVALPELLDAFHDRSRGGNLRQRNTMFGVFAAYGLARLGDPAALPGLREAAEDERADVRRAALLAIGPLATPADATTAEVLGGVVAADKDDPARAFAALSLGRSGAASAPDALRAAYANGTGLVRSYAALGLGLFSRRKADAAVNEFLLSELAGTHDTYETGALCIANGLARNLPAATRLAEIARTEGDREMRSHAAFALGLLNAEGMPPDVLIDLVVHGDPMLRHEAALALGLARRRDGVDALLRIVAKGGGTVERASACVALGRIAGSEAAAALIEILRDEHEVNALRICAAHGLGLLVDRSEGRKLGPVGADVNWITDTNYGMPTDALDQFLGLMD